MAGKILREFKKSGYGLPALNVAIFTLGIVLIVVLVGASLGPVLAFAGAVAIPLGLITYFLKAPLQAMGDAYLKLSAETHLWITIGHLVVIVALLAGVYSFVIKPTELNNNGLPNK